MLLPPFNLPDNILLLLTDTLPSPASFLLHRALAAHLKSPTSPSSSLPTRKKATIISVSEDLTKWKAIAAKSNINLSHQIDSGSITFIDALSLVQPPPPPTPSSSSTTPPKSPPPLHPLFESIIASLPSLSDDPKEEPGHHHLVILDDITTLEWIGLSLLDISRFFRALAAACRKVNAALIVLHHSILSDEIDDLFRLLLQLCTYHLEVRSLASGRSGAVNGEIALHAGPSTITSQVKLLPRSSALQYRLSDTGVVFFERGSGAAVL